MTLRSYYETVLYAKEPETVTTRRTRCERNLASIYENFNSCVQSMEETVLVPTLLKDIEDKDHPLIPTFLKKSNCNNLYEIFHLLKKVKSQMNSIESLDEFDSSFLLYELKENQEEKAATPKVSMDSGYWSITSTCSDDDDDSSSSISSCNSDIEGPAMTDFYKTTALCVKNLCSILLNLQEAADYITHRYLESMGVEFTP